ncbi:MAG: mannose-6-phosphate isomerase, class I [Spirochaetales bacterium]
MNENSAPVFKLENTIRNYAWGSYDGLSLFAGIQQDAGKPSAECWMGDHPDAPSSIILPEGNRLSLQRYIRDYPMKTLGEEVFSEFGDLPFLFKVLSASMPLSIQVHPDKAKAEEGFDREERSGIPRSAPERNYKDRNHKPELAVALSRFSALCGFREASEAAAFLGPELSDYFDFDPFEAEASFRSLLGKALTLRDKERMFLENRAVSRARELAASDDARAKIAGETTLRCFQHYPHDPGSISPLFMSVHLLEPGQGLYIPPGIMHAYLKGTVLEIMATSDNVIRGGLTQKHIDVSDLLGTLDFKAEPALIDPESSDKKPWEVSWKTPAREFSLSRLDIDESRNVKIEMDGPEILLCAEGSASIACESPAERKNGTVVAKSGHAAEIVIGRGESAFIGASCKKYSLRGKGRVYMARAGGEA